MGLYAGPIQSDVLRKVQEAELGKEPSVERVNKKLFSVMSGESRGSETIPTSSHPAHRQDLEGLGQRQEN